MEQEKLEKILGRPEHTEFIDQINPTLESFYKGRKILITGGNGSLGRALADWFDEWGISDYLLTDVDTLVRDRNIRRMDVLNEDECAHIFAIYNPDLVFHFAAQKHAPDGEENPLETTDLNVTGTFNILESAHNIAKVIVSSTCKSIAPETSYGASKLIADRMTLNYGQNVVRYFNVVQSSGNVFEIWDKTGTPYFVADCKRYFISVDEATVLTLFAGMQDSGRYAIDPGEIRNMIDIATDLYGKDDLFTIPRRRGDRQAEPLAGKNEFVQQLQGPIYKIVNYNDKIVQSV